jgi:hypothetical protein
VLQQWNFAGGFSIVILALVAYSGPSRPLFRRDADRRSDLMATGIPVGSRPLFRSNPTGCL